jgi:hypothetical protein
LKNPESLIGICNRSFFEPTNGYLTYPAIGMTGNIAESQSKAFLIL